MSATAVLLAGVGRVIQDLLLWCTAEFGYLRLADGFVQSSSIMPQKRNPVALEHARALASKALGQAGAILLAVHNTPFGDIVDTEDDLQPLVASMFDGCDAGGDARGGGDGDARRSTASGWPSARGSGWITVTELADTLTRDHGVPFRTSHAVASRFVAEAGTRPDVPRRDAPARDHERGRRAADRSTTRPAGRGPEPGVLRPRAHDARRPGAGRDRARDRRVTRAVGG